MDKITITILQSKDFVTEKNFTNKEQAAITYHKYSISLYQYTQVTVNGVVYNTAKAEKYFANQLKLLKKHSFSEGQYEDEIYINVKCKKELPL